MWKKTFDAAGLRKYLERLSGAVGYRQPLILVLRRA